MNHLNEILDEIWRLYFICILIRARNRGLTFECHASIHYELIAIPNSENALFKSFLDIATTLFTFYSYFWEIYSFIARH